MAQLMKFLKVQMHQSAEQALTAMLQEQCLSMLSWNNVASPASFSDIVLALLHDCCWLGHASKAVVAFVRQTLLATYHLCTHSPPLLWP